MQKHAKSYFFSVLAASMLLLSTPALTWSQGVGPVEPTEPEPAPKAPDHFPNQYDEGVQAFVSSLIGKYRGDDHTLYINTVTLPDSAPALYVEMVIAGEENHPVRQQLWVPHRRNGKLLMRVCELPLGMQDLVVGMWAAPSIFPPARIEQYNALGDLPIESAGNNYTVRSVSTMPIAREGAIEYELRIERTDQGVSWKDSGRSINSEMIFELDVAMKKRPEMPVARKFDGGILVYDLREGFVGPTLTTKDSIAFKFFEWSMEGFLIDSTDRPHRGAQVFTVPDDGKALRSWNIGMLGLREGGIRRMYDPKSQTGVLNGQVTPFKGGPMPLVTEVTVISIKDNTP